MHRGDQAGVARRLVELVQDAVIQHAQLADVGIDLLDVAGVENLDADSAGLGETLDGARIEPAAV